MIQKPFIAEITAKTYSGGKWLYSWEEQLADPNTFDYALAEPARRGSSTVSTAYEINNLEVDVGTYVVMYLRGHYQGQLTYEFVAPDSTGSSGAFLAENQIGFGNASDELTGSDTLTTSQSGGLNDINLTTLGDSPSSTSSVRFRRGGTSGTDGFTTGEIGRVSAYRLVSSTWIEQAYLSFQMNLGERQVYLSCYNDTDGFVRVRKTGGTPDTICDLIARQVNVGDATSIVTLGPVTSNNRLVGTLNGSNAIQGVTVGTGLTYDATAGTLVATATSYTDEMVDDRVATLIQNGTGITWSYNDGAGTLTPTVTITQYTDEMARDALGTALTEGYLIDIAVNDGSDTITLEKKFRGCRAYRSGAGSAPGYGSTWGSVAFDAENYDTDTIHDTSTNNSRFTIPTGMGGYWRFVARIYPDPVGNAGAVVQSRLLLNGATVLDADIGEVLTSGSVTVKILETTRAFSAGDYVELQMYHTGAGAMSYYNNDVLTWMECEFLGVTP